MNRRKPLPSPEESEREVWVRPAAERTDHVATELDFSFKHFAPMLPRSLYRIESPRETRGERVRSATFIVVPFVVGWVVAAVATLALIKPLGLDASGAFWVSLLLGAGFSTALSMWRHS